MLAARERIEQITNLLFALSEREQNALLKELKKKKLLVQAKRLKGSFKKNPITMQNIINEIRVVRQQLYEARKNCS